jgi:hypothetical protein
MMPDGAELLCRELGGNIGKMALRKQIWVVIVHKKTIN